MRLFRGVTSTTRRPHLLVVADPSMAFLDAAGVVLLQIRQMRKDIKISLLFLDKKNVRQFDLLDAVGAIASQNADEFLVADGSRVQRYQSVQHLHRGGENSISRHFRNDPPNAVLMDPSASQKPAAIAILEGLSNAHYFFVEHGVIPEPPRNRFFSFHRTGKTQTFYGTFVDNKLNSFATIAPDSQAKRVGLLRTHSTWQDAVKMASPEVPDAVAGGAVVITRPFPEAELIRHLETIYSVVFERFQLPVVVRVHPKAFGHKTKDATDIVRSVFPAKEEGLTWSMSKAHPARLAASARVGIMFFSNLCFDFVASGVPVIEYPGTGNSLYRNIGAVRPANSANQLSEAVHEALAGPELWTSQKAALAATLMHPVNVNQIVEDILEVLS